MSEQEQTPRKPEIRHSRWPGWIWAVPIAALGIVIWLGVRSIVSQGPQVTVTFTSAGGVKAGQTKVKYNDMEVGEVEAVSIKKDLKHVEVTLNLSSHLEGHLGAGTRYWIAGTSLSLADLSDIRTIISGPYIGIDPHPGKTVHHVTGLPEEPVLKAEPEGKSFTLHADRLGTVSRGSPIYFHDLKVGEVQGYKLLQDQRSMEIVAFVQHPYDVLVHKGTRFWNASAVQLSSSGGSPSLQFQSLPGLFVGALAFETPSGLAEGPPAKAGDNFPLYPSKGEAENAPDPLGVAYAVRFPSPDNTLDVGAPVQLGGRRVGSVTKSRLEYDRDTGHLGMQAEIVLEPAHIVLAGAGKPWQPGDRTQMDEMLRKLIGQGLRAELSSKPPVVGSKMIVLHFVPNAPPATLVEGSPPVIPSTSASGIDGIMAQVSDVAGKINAMPLPQIANDIHQATEKLAALSQSPELTESLHHLDQSLTNVDAISADTRRRIDPILAQLHRTADEAQATLASARAVLGTGRGSETQPATAGVPATLYQLSRAARSLRELADYLDRHPEALLKGKGANE